ncbi:hypothetical protein [Actinosynnema sp. NPDC020468]|uniref:hypothetical protein n=1 Tax=Actinosynnema sp. NPDC020468 TaxID=3154488 RepID=UPI0033D6BAFE
MKRSPEMFLNSIRRALAVAAVVAGLGVLAIAPVSAAAVGSGNVTDIYTPPYVAP